MIRDVVAGFCFFFNGDQWKYTITIKYYLPQFNKTKISRYNDGAWLLSQQWLVSDRPWPFVSC